MTDERQLIEDARTGSVGAFTQLVERYRDNLFRFLLTRCRSRADAEDALQDTLINAYRYLHTYDARWRFSTWLYRIALRNAMRADRGDAAVLEDVADAAAGPLENAIAASERRNLWSVARRALSDDVYAALWLRYAEDLPVREVASALDRSVSWTKVNLLRARRTLDAELNPTQNEAYG